MRESHEVKWKESQGYHFSIYPKWRRGGVERRHDAPAQSRGVFRRDEQDRRRTLLMRLSRIIFPRGFEKEETNQV
ncbi:MAG: hypothetical protein MI742_02340 [Desulfobacterales bacterium]|nr:hypothetical protein [Desulfobacterales bacterium]